MIFKSRLRQNLPFLLVVLATATHLAISLKLATYWYNNFNLGKYDLGNAVQVVNNTLHGKFFTYTDRFGTQISRLSNHADFILLLLVPFFAVFPSPVTLIVAQCLALSLGGLVVYLLARAVKLSKLAAFLIALAYFLNPDIGYLGLDAFHGITFAIPFVLLSFYFLEKGSRCVTTPCHSEESRSIRTTKNLLSGIRDPSVRCPSDLRMTDCRRYLYGFLLSTFLVLISKEEASLLVAFLGLYAWLVKKQKKLGLVLAGVGLSWFAIYFLIISPAYGPAREASVAQFAAQFPELASGADYVAVVRENPFISRYSHLGSSIKEIVLSPILKPKVVAQGTVNWPYTLRLLGPVGFLALLAPAALLIALPEYLINTLSGGGSMAQKYYGVFHYVSLIIPVVFYAAILGVKRLESIVGRVVTHRHSEPRPVGAKNLLSVRRDPSVRCPSDLRMTANLLAFLIFSSSLFFAFREHNPVLVNPITLASQHLGPSLQQIYNKYSYLLPQKAPEVGGIVPGVPVVGQAPITPSETPSGTVPPVTVPTHGPTVYIQNPKHGGGDAAVYKLLKGRIGAISGPSSLGAKLVVREDYNLFPVHWRESQFVAANFTGAPKTLGSVEVVFGSGVEVNAASFLREAVWEVENDSNYGVLHSGDGLLVFERGLTRPLFESMPVLERVKPIGVSRAVGFYNFGLPEEFVRGTAQLIEFGWEVDKSLVMEKGRQGKESAFSESDSSQSEESDSFPDSGKPIYRNELLEGAPFIAFVAEGDRVAEFYEILYGLFFSLDQAEGPQRVRQLITLPKRLEPGGYKVYLGWYELLGREMPGHAKLKDTIKLGSVRVR